VLASASGGANALWLTEWLAEALDLQPGMRVLDLGCGRAMSSIFLRREFGVQVWATDLWCSASENLQRIRDAGVEDGVFPIHADARSLPFATEFFDAIVSIDSFPYYGTDDFFLNYLARFVKPGGRVGIAGAAMIREMDGAIPEHLRAWWAQDLPWCLHSAAWWRRHWEQTGILDIALADTLPDGWRFWLEWLRLIAPDNATEIQALEADAGAHFRLRPGRGPPPCRGAIDGADRVRASEYVKKAATTRRRVAQWRAKHYNGVTHTRSMTRSSSS
jgi:SAM-dependent methyltransferase